MILFHSQRVMPYPATNPSPQSLISFHCFRINDDGEGSGSGTSGVTTSKMTVIEEERLTSPTTTIATRIIHAISTTVPNFWKRRRQEQKTEIAAVAGGNTRLGWLGHVTVTPKTLVFQPFLSKFVCWTSSTSVSTKKIRILLSTIFNVRLLQSSPSSPANVLSIMYNCKGSGVKELKLLLVIATDAGAILSILQRSSVTAAEAVTGTLAPLEPHPDAWRFKNAPLPRDTTRWRKERGGVSLGV